jgi:hypothetical protein
MDYNENIVHRLCQEFDQLAGSRTNWEEHWQEIAERIFPAHSRLFSSLSNQMTKGDKRNQLVFDSTAPIALKRFGAILDSLLTPRNQTWHKLLPSDITLLKNRQVMLWFEDANRILMKYRYAAAANFASQNQQNYLSLGAYGTGCMFVDQLSRKPGLRYRNCHLGEVFFSENHQGIVDKAFRRFSMTARQLAQKWPDKIPDTVKTRLINQPETVFEIKHIVEPREDLDPNRKDYKGMPFASYYLMKEGYTLLEEGGYSTFPYCISRYEQAPGETYGRSPAMDVLPAIKTLNEQKKTVLKQGHRAVDPVLLLPDDGVLDGLSMKPGALNVGGVDAQGRALVHALPVGNVNAGREMMEDERKIINDAFLVTIFQILVESPEMTATEVLERTKEKGILLAPTIGRQQTEYLGPMIEREIDLLAQQGLLPPMPKILSDARGEYRIEYDSPISRTQRAEEASGFMRTLDSAIQIANVNQDMTIFHHFNFDEIMPEVAQINGVPERWMNPLQKVMQMRQQVAEQQQTQQYINAAPATAAMIKAQAAVQKTKV